MDPSSHINHLRSCKLSQSYFKCVCSCEITYNFYHYAVRICFLNPARIVGQSNRGVLTASSTSVLASLSYASIMFHRRKRQGEPKMKSWRKQELENTEKEADAAPVELEHREPMIPELENSAALSELPTYDHSIQELSTGYPWLELGDD